MTSTGEPILAGCFAGVVGTLLGYPLDTLRVHQATEQRTDGKGGLVATGRRLIRQRGLQGLYSGVTSPLFSLVVLNAVSFGGYSQFSRILGSSKTELVRSKDNLQSPWWVFEYKVFFAGSLCGGLAACISTPFELVKTQMQLHAGSNSKSSLSVASRLIRERGLMRGLYLGHGVNSVREVAFVSTYFGVYEHAKPMLRALLACDSTTMEAGNAPNSPIFRVTRMALTPLAGGLAGAAAWAVSYPFDCVKVNIQGEKVGSRSGAKEGAISVAVSLLRRRGILGLYTGLGASVLRAFLVSGTRFSAFEVAMWAMK